jgi:hypothetical protein
MAGETAAFRSVVMVNRWCFISFHSSRSGGIQTKESLTALSAAANAAATVGGDGWDAGGRRDGS